MMFFEFLSPSVILTLLGISALAVASPTSYDVAALRSRKFQTKECALYTNPHHHRFVAPSIPLVDIGDKDQKTWRDQMDPNSVLYQASLVSYSPLLVLKTFPGTVDENIFTVTTDQDTFKFVLDHNASCTIALSRLNNRTVKKICVVGISQH